MPCTFHDTFSYEAIDHEMSEPGGAFTVYLDVEIKRPVDGREPGFRGYCVVVYADGTMRVGDWS
jgi:hypothetical protein